MAAIIVAQTGQSPVSQGTSFEGGENGLDFSFATAYQSWSSRSCMETGRLRNPGRNCGLSCHSSSRSFHKRECGSACESSTRMPSMLPARSGARAHSDERLPAPVDPFRPGRRQGSITPAMEQHASRRSQGAISITSHASKRESSPRPRYFKSLVVRLPSFRHISARCRVTA